MSDKTEDIARAKYQELFREFKAWEFKLDTHPRYLVEWAEKLNKAHEAIKEARNPLEVRVANFIKLSPVKYATFEEATIAMFQALKEQI